jgi:hypothetical protein
MTREQWKQMTPDQRRIKVAELCGWESFPLSDGCPNWWKRGKDERINSHYLPDYENDLNAMHEAEKTISEAFLRRRYYQYMDIITGDQWNTIVATAAQRAEAFAITLSSGGA